MLDHLQRTAISDDLGIVHATDWSIVQLWFRGTHIGDIHGEAALREGVSGSLPDGSSVHLQLYGPAYFADIEVLRDGEVVKRSIARSQATRAPGPRAPMTSGPLSGSPYAEPAVRRPDVRPGVKRDLERAGLRLFFCALAELASAFLLVSVVHALTGLLAERGVAFNERPYIIAIWIFFGALAAIWAALGALCRFRHSPWAAIAAFLLYFADIAVTIRYASYLPIYYFAIKALGLIVLGRGAMSAMGEHWRRKDLKRAARGAQS